MGSFAGESRSAGTLTGSFSMPGRRFASYGAPRPKTPRRYRRTAHEGASRLRQNVGAGIGVPEMGRFAVSKDDDRLTLSQSYEGRHLINGCLMFFVASICTMTLGILALVNEMSPDHSGQSFTPQGNHFGFLWLVSCALTAILLPLHFHFSRKSRILFSFERGTGVFTRNNRKIARLSRLEYVQVRTHFDPDEQSMYQLSIFHDDGHETTIDDSYDEIGVRVLAQEIAEFAGVRTVAKRPDTRVRHGG